MQNWRKDDDDATNNEGGKKDGFVSAYITKRMDSAATILATHANILTLINITDNNDINVEYLTC